MNGLLMRSGEVITSELSQTSARWQVLGRAAYERQTVAKMARDMGHARQSVQRIANALAKEGLVVYVDNPSDQRAKLVALTPQGQQVLAAIHDRYKQWAKQVTARLTPGLLATAADALANVEALLEIELRTE